MGIVVFSILQDAYFVDKQVTFASCFKFQCLETKKFGSSQFVNLNICHNWM